MSLGAIDFGLIVDSSVIMVENCMHRLTENAAGVRSRIEVIRDACIEVRKPTMFGELIIAVVYVPVLMLQGTEGKLFRPMALTVLFALVRIVDSFDDPDAGTRVARPSPQSQERRCLVHSFDQGNSISRSFVSRSRAPF